MGDEADPGRAHRKVEKSPFRADPARSANAVGGWIAGRGEAPIDGAAGVRVAERSSQAGSSGDRARARGRDGGEYRLPSPIAACEVLLETRALATNAACKTLFGHPSHEPFSLDDLFAAVMRPDRQLVRTALETAFRHRVAVDISFRLKALDRRVRRICLQGDVIDEGSEARLVAFASPKETPARGAAPAAGRPSEFWSREMAHRFRNTLPLVLAVVRLTGDASGDVASFRASLDQRLRALMAASALLPEEGDGAWTLHAIAERELLPFPRRAGRIVLDGPEVRLTRDAAQAFALILHELACNACKHGALGVSDGQVTVSWRTGGPRGRRLALRWRESGGPEVRPTRHRGFGTSILVHGGSSILGGTAEIDFHPAGLRYRLILADTTEVVAPSQ